MIKVQIFNGLLNVLSFLFLFISTFVSAHAQTEQESESEILADAELDPSSRDLIADQPKVLGLGFGASEAWQRFSGTFLFCFHEDFCSDSALGGGRFVLNRETDAKDFRLRIDARSVVTSLRYFLPIGLPVFSQTGFGLALLHIDAKPSGGVEDGDDASTRLRFGGNAEALFLSQQFGFESHRICTGVGAWNLVYQ
jgi:hypothetical protein